MTVFFNGQFVPEEQAAVSIFDRGFLYGDGLFETMRAYGGKPFRWRQHWERMRRGAEHLKIRLNYSEDEAARQIERLIQLNSATDAIVRFHLSRGAGERGYSAKLAQSPCLVMSVHPAPGLDPRGPVKWRLATSTMRVAIGQTLSSFKTCNRLPQIMARAEAEAQGLDEAVLLNSEGRVAEAASSNIFLIEAGRLVTPGLPEGPLPGITRSAVRELSASLKMPCLERPIAPNELKDAEGVFLTLSTMEIVEAVSLDAAKLKRSPLTGKIWKAYRELVESEVS